MNCTISCVSESTQHHFVVSLELLIDSAFVFTAQVLYSVPIFAGGFNNHIAIEIMHDIPAVLVRRMFTLHGGLVCNLLPVHRFSDLISNRCPYRIQGIPPRYVATDKDNNVDQGIHVKLIRLPSPKLLNVILALFLLIPMTTILGAVKGVWLDKEDYEAATMLNTIQYIIWAAFDVALSSLAAFHGFKMVVGYYGRG